MAQFDHGEEVGDSEEATKSLESFVSQYTDAQGRDFMECNPVLVTGVIYKNRLS